MQAATAAAAAAKKKALPPPKPKHPAFQCSGPELEQQLEQLGRVLSRRWLPGMRVWVKVSAQATSCAPRLGLFAAPANKRLLSALQCPPDAWALPPCLASITANSVRLDPAVFFGQHHHSQRRCAASARALAAARLVHLAGHHVEPAALQEARGV